ncbi:hypothetical protein OG339_47930 (plasmid) [Streptosporangium sp. NBC_01495]|uniref:hypothetical protein n=1 Tax=Streptosporangium sp. NBC_01495 TaxID=2903899 RepID=UPI002E33A684|nr:hypothetical protein [Streptosporangium sp. NBC_01495]
MCLTAGGTLAQALDTLSREIARDAKSDDIYPLVRTAVHAAAAKAVPHRRRHAHARRKDNDVFAGLPYAEQQQVLEAVIMVFPAAYEPLSPDYCDAANRIAEFLPKINDMTLPCLSIGGVAIFAYLHHRTGAVRVSVDLDETWTTLCRVDSTVPVRVDVGDTIVFDDSNQARATNAIVPAPLHGIAAQFTPDEVECLVRTAAETFGTAKENRSTRQLDLVGRAHAALMREYGEEETP